MITKELEKEILTELIYDTTGRNVAKVFKILSIDDFSHYSDYAEIILQAWKAEENIQQALVLAGKSISNVLVEGTLFESPDRTARKLKLLNTTESVKNYLYEASEKVNEKTLEEDVSKIQQNLVAITNETKEEESNISSVVEDFHKYQAQYLEKQKNGGKLLGEPTGFEKLDDVIDGLRPGHLWVLGGYTNLGKTYASLNILTNLLKEGKRTVFYSLEMSKVDILCRVLGIMTDHNGSSIAKGFCNQEKVDAAIKRVEETNMSIYSDKSELSQILMSMYEEVLKDKPALFVIDFLQLITVKGSKSDYETTTQAALELQKAAQLYGVPIIVLSQVSNESAKAGDQQVMGFKGSGAIAAAADLAIELVSGEESVIELRQKMNDGLPVLIKWHIKKNRHGRVGSMMMQFTGKYGQFEEYDENDF